MSLIGSMSLGLSWGTRVNIDDVCIQVCNNIHQVSQEHDLPEPEVIETLQSFSTAGNKNLNFPSQTGCSVVEQAE